ncbi:MAG: geranyl transferase [Gammaproteobacteria bacterium]|nr:MAG: geranyl transferase [Gammaproteobacteria bacterium]
MSDIDAYLQRCKQRTDAALIKALPDESTIPCTLHRAIRYSTIDGGKRIRPCLVFATAEAMGGNFDIATPPACAVEMIHAYSLIHDDLPAMDDDALRRGKAACHIQFDEATAILAGDALQAMAFQTLCEAVSFSDQIRLKMIHTLAIASGSQGMAGGQAIDLAAEGRALDIAELESMHLFKTGALIEASVVLGALSAGIETESELSALRIFARCIGLAFQVKDDILDIEGDTETLGKQQGADHALNKATYPAILGLDAARQKCTQLHELGLEALNKLENGQFTRLQAISHYIVNRNH